jgi:hypothetical protein
MKIKLNHSGGLYFLVLLAILLPTLLSGCSKKEQKQQIELGDLLVWFMLDKNEGNPDWSMRSNSAKIPLVWSNDGVKENNFIRALVREGSARVAVNNKILWTLKAKKEEVKWDVLLEGSKFGVQKVEVRPNIECFGVGSSGCNFEWEEVFKNADNKSVKTLKLCSEGFPSEGGILYEIKASGKQDAYLLYITTSGSGGVTNWVELWWKLPEITENSQAACRHLKEVIH